MTGGKEPTMPTVILSGDYTDNYLTLGGRPFHVPVEAIEAARAEAQTMLAAERLVAAEDAELGAVEAETAPPAKPRKKRKSE